MPGICYLVPPFPFLPVWGEKGLPISYQSHFPTAVQVSQQTASSSPQCDPRCPPPPEVLDVSRQAMQECLSGQNLKVAARAGQGVGGLMLKSGSLELSSAKQQMSDREKALWTCWGTKGRSPSFSGSWFLSTTSELASVDSVPLLLGHWLS